MASPILFRSLQSGYDRSWSSLTHIKQRGYSWSHLRQYSDKDDIRDIVWKKIKPDGLSVRSRENEWDFKIIFYYWITPYDDFFEDTKNNSKANTIKNIRESISISAKFWWHPYQEFFWENKIKELQNTKPRNNLIFICNIDPLNIPASLAFHNDLIYLDIVNNFEEDPNTSLLFSWKIVDIKAYKNAYTEYKNTQKNHIKKIRGSYLRIMTKDNISNILNIFFKKRYSHG